MALRDTSWFHDDTTGGGSGLGTPLDSNARTIVSEKRPAEPLILANNTQLSRSRTIVTTEWICMTETAAINSADCMFHTDNRIANTTFTPVLVNSIGGEWKVVKEVDSIGTWT